MPRGGRRAGKQGSAYSNRTDLQSKKTLPPTAVPGQGYGQAGQQLAAQQTVPMGSPPVPDPQAPSGPMPGELPPLTGPSNMPGQPVQHGLPVGPGAGPEALPAAPDPVLKGLAILNTMKALPPELKAVQAYLQVSQNNGLNG